MLLKDKLKQNIGKIILCGIGGIGCLIVGEYILIHSKPYFKTFDLTKIEKENFGLFIEHDTIKFRESKKPYGIVSRQWNERNEVINIDSLVKGIMEQSDSTFIQYLDSVLLREENYGSVRWK
ncbi:MAG: hypothetical protein ISS82_01305 [Nanoarchaeota archaeon]|nr:hypothetical protein [Nanoarchaeota archaeon]